MDLAPLCLSEFCALFLVSDVAWARDLISCGIIILDLTLRFMDRLVIKCNTYRQHANYSDGHKIAHNGISMIAYMYITNHNDIQ